MANNRYANLENNLTTLQDLIKRDAASYREEFAEQYRHYENTLKLFQIQPDLDSSHLIDVISFLSQVAHCYPSETKTLSSDIIEILRSNGENLSSDLRLALCKCLTILRNKNLAAPLAVLQLFFDLCKCRDKALRKFVFDSTVGYVKRLKTSKKLGGYGNNSKSGQTAQSYIFTRIQDAHPVVARTALLICIDCYRRRVWRDAKTANAIGRACFHNVAKIFLAACKFFLGKDVFDEADGEDEESENENESNGNKKTLAEIMVGYRVGKKTKKRKKHMEKAKENLNKVDKKEKSKTSKAQMLDFSALHFLYDPQEFAENLLKKLEKGVQRFEAKLIMMALVARVVGVHKLQVLNFYPYLTKYLQPHQKEVTKILLFAAQASHDLVPPDVAQTLLKTVVNNFVSDRNSNEAITVGLNAVREIATKCPLAVDEDLLRDLTEYKKFKNKNVSMAAKSIIQTFRGINPTMLKKGDRGKPTEASKELKPIKYYGETQTAEFVPGAECLVVKENKEVGPAADGAEQGSVPVGPENESASDDAEEEETDEEDDGWEEDNGAESDDVEPEDEEDEEDDDKEEKPVQIEIETIQQISASRVFSQEEFRKIKAFQLKKHVLPAKGKKRKAEELEVDDDGSDSDESRKGELTRLRDIEHLSKKTKQDKASRMASVKEGREGREKFGKPKEKGPHVGRTNKNMKKRKAFSMVKQKSSRKTKGRSFRDKQQALKQYLIKQKKMR